MFKPDFEAVGTVTADTYQPLGPETAAALKRSKKKAASAESEESAPGAASKNSTANASAANSTAPSNSTATV